MTKKIALTVLLLAAPAARAKEGVSFGAGLEAAYDGNVWLLSDDKLDKPGTDTKSDDKYYRMETATDTVLSLYGRVDWEFRAAGGKKARLRLQPGAQLYRENGKKTHGSLDAELDHDVWKGGEVFLHSEVSPSRFHRNYLVDADPDGSSKVYDQGFSTEADVSAGVKSRLTRSLDGKLWVGAGVDAYDAPFENRSHSALEGGASLGLELGKRAGVGLAVRSSRITTGSDNEVVIEGGLGLNTPVDRSYEAYAVTPSIGIELSDAIDIRAVYEYRSRSYTTSDTVDPYHDRSDVRHTGLAELRFRLSKPLRLDVGGYFAQKVKDRANDGDASLDEPGYQRTMAWVGLAASF